MKQSYLIVVMWHPFGYCLESMRKFFHTLVESPYTIFRGHTEIPIHDM